MRRFGACLALILFAVLFGMPFDLADHRKAALAQDDEKPGEEIQAPGPLGAVLEYVLCLWDQPEHGGAVAVFRERGEKHSGKVFVLKSKREKGKVPSGEFIALRSKEIWKSERTEIVVRIREVTPAAVIYETIENRGQFHRLPRVTDVGDLSVPGRLLARFIAESTGNPILYDSRARIADRDVKVSASADPISPEQADALLKKHGIPLQKATLDSGRSFYKWTSDQPTAGSSGATAKKRSAGDLVLVVEHDADERGSPPGKVFVSRGKIQLGSALEFAANLWNLPVYTNLSEDLLKNDVIEMVSDVSEVGKEMLTALLEINGFSVSEVDIPGRGRALSIR